MLLGRWLLAILALSFLGAVLPALKSQSAPVLQVFPERDIGAQTLAARKSAQIQTVNQFNVFYQFQFSDQVRESGITFVHRSVDDAGRTHKANHYDHGTGMAVADVDGDGLYDIYFVNQLGGNELWKNLGGGKFRNMTAEAGVAVPNRVSVGASFADIDNDGDQDLFVTTVRGGNVLFENDGHGHFKDISKEAGVDLVAHSSGAFFFDYDKDGLSDLLVCNVGKYTTDAKGRDGAYVGIEDAFMGHMYPERFEYPVLYKNLGQGRFKNVTAETGLKPEGWCGDASFVDFNGDGFPGVYFLNMMGANHYFENVGGKKFVEKTKQYFPRTSWGAMGIKFFDFDNDGRMDLFVTDMHSDMLVEAKPEEEKRKSPANPEESYLMGPRSSFILGNSMYHNLGGGKFQEVSDSMGVENFWPWGPSIGDINADGWDDIFIASSMNFPFRYGINSMLLNNRGKKFLDAEFLLGIEPRRGGRTSTRWFDLDCSGADSTLPSCKGLTGKFTVMGTLGSRSSVLFDLDNDGDLDLVTNDFNSEPQVLVSNLSERKMIHWVKILLNGTVSNRDGLGATVRVRAGGQVYTKYNDGKSGYLSQSALPLYFGLGDATRIDRVEVSWPSGRKQVVTAGLKTNDTLRVTEPK